MAGSRTPGPGKIYFEFTQVGQQMRVAAIDEATGTEVIVVAPLNATQAHMQTIAEAKLRRRLSARADAEAKRNQTPQRGKLV
ncbi:DUF6898 family protein [Devosia sp.]|uniref:DUF6898 family protein n=1 Tax=Devosia sp. TaxID=1871048 RepID=UPI003A917F11